MPGCALSASSNPGTSDDLKGSESVWVSSELAAEVSDLWLAMGKVAVESPLCTHSLDPSFHHHARLREEKAIALTKNYIEEGGLGVTGL